MGEPTADVMRGPIVRPANRSRAAAGSIHDDTTATAAGFRGGTVAGNVHLDHFPPLLVEAFGPAWFEGGVLSMYFREPTTHLEPVQAALAPGAPEADLSDAWVLTPDGATVAEGAVGVAPYPAATPLRGRDRRPVDPTELVLLRRVPVGERLDAGPTRVDIDRQHDLLADRDLLPLPLDWYRDESRWGAPVACPSVAVDTLWAPFERVLRPGIERAVGLYGAIEIHHRGTPLLAGVEYRLDGVVTDVSRSPRTEILWAETTAWRGDEPVSSLIMMIRLLR